MKKQIISAMTAAITAIPLCSLQASAKDPDYRLWDKFLKYDLRITDYSALTDEEKELCRFIFETEQRSDWYDDVRCERARRILAGEDVGKRITLEELETTYGLIDYYSDYDDCDRWCYYTDCVPDIIHIDTADYTDVNGLHLTRSYNEYWLDDERSAYVVFYPDLIMNEDNSFIRQFSFDVFDSTGIRTDNISATVYDTPYFDFRGFDGEKERLGYTHKNGGWYYTKNDGTAVFAYCDRTGNLDDPPVEEPFIVESEIDGCPVKAIEHSAFFGARYKEIIIPDSVEMIDYFAFDHCTYLENITLPRGLKFMGHNAFYECGSLNELTVDCPDAVFKNNSLEYNKNKSLASVSINVKEIDESAFMNCIKLTDVTIGKDVKDINAYAFKKCTALEEIEIPRNVRTIGQGAFLGSGIKSVTIPPTVEIIGTLPRPIGEISYLDLGGEGTYPLTDKPVCAFNEDCVIYGYRGTEAERYAKEQKLEFVELEAQTGDVNIDGEISVADAVVLQKYLHGKYVPTGVAYGDINGDGAVDVFDMVGMRKMLIEK